jgi:uncharacterized protein
MGSSDCRFVWYELATTDAEAAKAFYASVVGWSAAGVAMPGYTLFISGGAPVAGLTKLLPGASQSGVGPQWLGYVAVDDVDAAARRAAKLGGTVHVPPTTIPDVSRFSIVADPQKATLGVLKGRESAGQPATQPPPGGVVWHELAAADMKTAFTFYNKLFDWRKAGAAPTPAIDYQSFSAGGNVIGGMFGRPEKPESSIWIFYFDVGNIKTALKRVTAGGGQIVNGPHELPGAIKIAQCLDPQGAIFGVIEKRLQIAISCYAPRDNRPKPR